MAQVNRYPFVSHLRAEANQHVLHYRKGRLVRKGPGIAYWFLPLSAAVAQVPVEDCETTFLLNERSSDLQDVSVQVTLTYRFVDPERAAARVNFTISLATGAWTEQPLTRLASFWSQRAQQPARAYLMKVPVVEAVGSGAEVIRAAVEESLRQDPAIRDMGLDVVSVQVIQVAPSADLEKALQTPTHEAIQQKADEAVFARRALAVEKERAIKENELATEIEMARRQEELILRQAANKLLAVKKEAEADQARAEAEASRTRVSAQADADAHRLLTSAQHDAEKRRVDLWRDAPGTVALGMGFRELAAKVGSIQHLNVTPDLFGAAFQQFLREQADK